MSENIAVRNHSNEHQDNARKYFYDFDAVLRHYMIKTFKPFFPQGKALEMGCYKGEVTERLLPFYQDLTVIEAAADLIESTRKRISHANIKFIHSTFENFNSSDKYDAIFLIHTLEHLDDPVFILKKARNWLTPQGKLFLVVPNADAPSRQIAVKMGLITHNNAVTPAELEHGHRQTYSFDTLERDVRLSGLKVAHRSGIFFKPLANFQFDQLLTTDIISQAYLEGCYELGQQYPELCASLFFLCQKD